jgi:thiamine monophosphate kinase
MNRRAISILLLGAAAGAGSAFAHHSFSATYDETAEVRIEGEVAQFLFRNPHSLVHVAAPGEDGGSYRWSIEWAGIGALSGEGVTRESLRIGDHVIVTGNPGRNPADHRLRLLSIERPLDGWSWKGTFN